MEQFRIETCAQVLLHLNNQVNGFEVDRYTVSPLCFLSQFFPLIFFVLGTFKILFESSSSKVVLLLLLHKVVLLFQPPVYRWEDTEASTISHPDSQGPKTSLFLPTW